MVWNILSALGGVGIFLVGMLMLTGGLKGLAGRQMREILAQFTRTPLSGAVTGALTTAVVQSSSATTVTAVGFVAAGILTFPQALGIIFGANIGTTLTGWMVATLGFKLDLGEAVLPVIFLGAVLHLSGRPRLAALGQALAGFGLLFIGIDHLKDGLEAFEGVVTPSDFPDDSFWGRLQLVGIGLLITLVTQSSSAGVATALAALGAGAINFPQAAALVIGMDVGTTFTALLATVGGGTMTRRTGSAHVIYNVLTGIMALALLGPYASLVAPWIAEGSGQIALVGFHTLFNGLGVILVLPLARPFARLIEWLVPERGTPLTAELDPALVSEPRVATVLARECLGRLNTATCDLLGQRLGGTPPQDAPTYEPGELRAALTELRAYLDRIRLTEADRAQAAIIGSAFHAIDHLFRLLHRCEQAERVAALASTHRLRRLSGLVARGAACQARPEDPITAEAALDRLRQLARDQRKRPRDRIVDAAVTGRITDEDALHQLDALRWLHRTCYHLWRIRVHQNAAAPTPAPAATASEEARIDVAQD
ncbi:Na/Pi cotransporter [Salipiger sp. CCB-MM3]|uniref:Na/Pi cotransporter family protein n=1 Tax=Salipiger sp. CCB-MM3 TaxID=1792508 RepID=UPI00080AA46C|nr:Na/Pi symporter [Salipiger sp. CCB-MM3]ANT62485.1 Na/Pi cotransporter [Salipiger sp. CCB-MM3]